MQDAVSVLPPDFTLLQVTPELETGGAEQTTIDVAHAVIAAGGKALVATRGGRMTTRLESDGGRLVQLPMQSKNPLVMLGNAARLIEVIRREKVSIVHARSRAPAFSALAAANAAGVPFVATYHGVYHARNPLKRWYNAVMTRGALVIANSEFTRDHILAEHGVDSAKVVTIPRGVDMTRFDPRKVSAERVAALQTAWGVSKSKTQFLLPGRLTRIKGHMTIIAAAAKLIAEGRRDFQIVFAGDDQGRIDYRRDLETAIASAGLGDIVRLVGHCDDMPAAYRACDVALLPTTVPESFGRAAVEPQVMERTVIVSDHGAVRETVLQEETGWRVPAGDPDAWAAALAHAIDVGAAARRSMARAAAGRARKLYSVDAMCDATLEVYARVLRERR